MQEEKGRQPEKRSERLDGRRDSRKRARLVEGHLLKRVPVLTPGERAHREVLRMRKVREGYRELGLTKPTSGRGVAARSLGLTKFTWML